MQAVIEKKPLCGTVRAIPSKSDAHRKLICAALADRPTTLRLPERCADIDATAACLRALGAKLTEDGENVTVEPIGTPEPHPVLDCGESGSTLRFILPVAAALGCDASFIGHGRLPERPISALSSVMKEHGVSFSAENLPFTISGRLTGGVFALPGDISSQYITGLLLALPLCGGGEVKLTTELQSSAYVDMTKKAMSDFGVTVSGLRVGTEKYRSPGSVFIDGDWSSAAFPLAAGAIGGNVTVTGLDANSLQGDKAVTEILRQMGARISIDGDSVTISAAPMTGCVIDVRQIPDLLPVLCVAAAFAKGETRFINAARLRLKESDRLETTARLIRSLGGRAEVYPDSMTVYGTPLTGGIADGAGDHRIVMSAAVAMSLCSGTVTGVEATEKSYPSFFADFARLGGIALVSEG